MNTKRFYVHCICMCLFVILISAEAFANSSEAFMSLPFGHSWTRTKLRMTRSGAVVTAEKKGESLTMKGMFEGHEAIFMFNFVKKKGLSSKVANIGSAGNADNDRMFYDALKIAFENRYGQIKERATTTSGIGMGLRSHWAPDLTTDITLTYNPNVKRFSGDLVKDSPIRLSFITGKWNN